MSTTNHSDEKNSTKTLVFSFAIIAVVMVAVLGVVVSYSEKREGFIGKIEKIVPYPVAMIGWTNFVTFSELDSNLNSVKRFYENQDFSKIGLRVDFNTEEGKIRLKIKEKDILNKMIEDKAIESLTEKNDIKLSDVDVDAAVSRELEKYGTEEDVKKRLANLYGWNMDDFKKKIVRPDLLRVELEKMFAKNSQTAIKAENKIKEAKKKLDQGKEFEEVARTYSEGETAENGGELGWFSGDQLVNAVSQKVGEMKKGETSGIIESDLGFHIVKLEDEKNDENGATQYQLKQIFIRKELFYQWLFDQIKEKKIFIFYKGYVWNRENSQVDFKDENMKKNEEILMNESSGDPSLMF